MGEEGVFDFGLFKQWVVSDDKENILKAKNMIKDRIFQ
jgi:hypothetical protein